MEYGIIIGLKVNADLFVAPQRDIRHRPQRDVPLV